MAAFFLPPPAHILLSPFDAVRGVVVFYVMECLTICVFLVARRDVGGGSFNNFLGV